MAKITFKGNPVNTIGELPAVGSKAPDFKGIYTRKGDHMDLSLFAPHQAYQYHQLFNNYDGVILNGNHFTARKQVLLINEKKRESTAKKLDRLTDVRFIIMDEDHGEIYDYLIEEIPEIQQLPMFKSSDIEGIARQFLLEVKSNTAPLNGLVFAGGKSSRMGTDKAMIDYHGKPQLEFAADLLSQFTEQTYISESDTNAYEQDFPKIKDSFVGLGPFGGLCSAFRENPNSAWLTVPCDTPLLDKETFDFLVSERDPSKLATCFHNPETQFPEPLITIWEPRAYPVLLNFLAMGYSCPRKVLINSDVKELHLEDPGKLLNVNTQEERSILEERSKK